MQAGVIFLTDGYFINLEIKPNCCMAMNRLKSQITNFSESNVETDETEAEALESVEARTPVHAEIPGRQSRTRACWPMEHFHGHGRFWFQVDAADSLSIVLLAFSSAQRSLNVKRQRGEMHLGQIAARRRP